ncbi:MULTISPECIES: hypothetical protein [unclassified Haloferax]|uniref:hypothetical protein n=1 Tax=unclassified Haloferax TaxID=2625095 RepID=UPI0011C060A0|nr:MULTISPECIES: hypothetical protein [unclassified Haloferax]
MSEELKFRSTELLFLQYLMDGSNYGAKYDSFRLSDLGTADFKGNEGGNIQDSDIVQQANQTGQLCHVRFYTHFTDDNGHEKSVQIQLYGDGHLRTSVPVPVRFFNEIVSHVDSILEYRIYLVPITELMAKYVDNSFGFLPEERIEHIQDTQLAFKGLVSEYFDSSEYEGDERHIYESIVANIGKELNTIRDLSKSKYPNPSGVTEFPNQENKVGDFFNDYARLEQGSEGHNFGTLSAHLDHILTAKNWQSPVDLIAYVENKYHF